jgi:uncharacterized protein
VGKAPVSLDSLKRIVRQFITALSAADVSGCMSLMSDDATYWIAGKPELSRRAGTKTRAEFCRMLGASPAKFEERLTFTLGEMTAEGTRVAV